MLSTWCEELTHWKRPWCWERLKAGREGDDRTRWLDGTTDLTDMSLGKLWEVGMHREACHAAVPGVTKSQTPLSDWTELNWACCGPLPWQSNKAILFYFTPNSLRFNSVPVYNRWILATPLNSYGPLFHSLLLFTYSYFCLCRQNSHQGCVAMGKLLFFFRPTFFIWKMKKSNFSNYRSPNQTL